MKLSDIACGTREWKYGHRLICFRPDEFRCSENLWLVTKKGINRLGALKRTFVKWEVTAEVMWSLPSGCCLCVAQWLWHPAGRAPRTQFVWQLHKFEYISVSISPQTNADTFVSHTEGYYLVPTLSFLPLPYFQYIIIIINNNNNVSAAQNGPWPPLYWPYFCTYTFLFRVWRPGDAHIFLLTPLCFFLHRHAHDWILPTGRMDEWTNM
jgi:hypothetical protein